MAFILCMLLQLGIQDWEPTIIFHSPAPSPSSSTTSIAVSAIAMAVVRKLMCYRMGKIVKKHVWST
jgi:hypothetical protein